MSYRGPHFWQIFTPLQGIQTIYTLESYGKPLYILVLYLLFLSTGQTPLYHIFDALTVGNQCSKHDLTSQKMALLSHQSKEFHPRWIYNRFEFGKEMVLPMWIHFMHVFVFGTIVSNLEWAIENSDCNSSISNLSLLYYNWLIDFNGISTCLGLFYIKSLGNWFL